MKRKTEVDKVKTKLNAPVLKTWGKMNSKLNEVEERTAKVISGSTGMLIDKQARFIFPSAFLAFNVVYWITVIIAVSIGRSSYETIEIISD